MASLARYALSFCVPHSALQACKDALFAAGAGAGTYPGGKYSYACFETAGTGQFRPNEGAMPNIGAVAQVEKVPETKVEMICVGWEVMERSVTALKEAHPYEEVCVLCC
jgi:hypothetical protein